MVTVVIAAEWVKNLTAGSFLSVYISDHERPNCQFLNSGSSHGSTSRHNDIEWEDLLHELPQQMFFLNLDEKSFLFHTEMAERSHFRKNLANPKLGPQKGPNQLWIGGCSLPWSLCATIIPSQIQAWYFFIFYISKAKYVTNCLSLAQFHQDFFNPIYDILSWCWKQGICQQ